MITNEQLIEYLLTKGWEFSHSELTQTYYLHPDCQHRILTTPNLVFDTAIKILADFERLSFVDICNKIASQWIVLSSYQGAPLPNEEFYMLIRSNNHVTTFKAYNGCWNSMEGHEFNPLKDIALHHSVYRLINRR